MVGIVEIVLSLVEIVEIMLSLVGIVPKPPRIGGFHARKGPIIGDLMP